MQSVPESYSTDHVEAFQDQQVVEAYRYRPPYPQEIFAFLAALALDEPKTVLDVGAGTGNIARPLAELVAQVDAVDFSQQMLAQGKLLPGGGHPRLRWISGKIEEVPLASQYSLITAGASIHWFEWKVVFPRFRQMLTAHGTLALIYHRTLPMPWEPELGKIFADYVESPGHQGMNAVPELERQGFFQRYGERTTVLVPFVQSIDDYIESLHSRSNFSRARMGAANASAFDQQVRMLLQPFHPDGILSFQVVATVTWGVPENGND